MASKSGTKTATEPVPFSTPSEPREVTKSKEAWSEYSLDDGAVLRVRPIVVEARRAKGKFTEEGNPLYYVRIGFILGTRAPARLKRKPKSVARKTRRRQKARR